MIFVPATWSFELITKRECPMNVELFKETEENYLRLKDELTAGKLTLNHFDLAVKGTKVKDPIGRPWLIDSEKGRWYVYDGSGWVPADPYRTLVRMALVPELPSQAPSCTILGIHVHPPSKTHKIWLRPPPLRSDLLFEPIPAQPSRTILPAWLQRVSIKRQSAGAISRQLFPFLLVSLLLLGVWLMFVLLGGMLAAN